ncbi:MAG TPA: DUF1080 domain-containing protein [Isosphaeraceae bacterium]|nr:DUF1080 domain-containing protein [Isosphaeraceae bacterium]
MRVMTKALLFWLVAGTIATADEGWTDLLPAGSLEAWKPPHHAWAFVSGVHLKDGNPKLLDRDDGDGNVLWNGPTGRTGNIVTKEKFGDVELHVEFVVPKGSNSGVKLHGHYEIQISDCYGKPTATASDCGGIYPRAELLPRYHHIDEGYPPRVNACKPPGEWQTMDITFRAPEFDKDGNKTRNARFEKVVLNGEVIHADVDLPYPTGHAWHNKEMREGPILLQGDHGPVAFRNLRVRALKSSAK